jgi:hypothetical protein
MLDDLLEAYEFQGKLVNYDSILLHFEKLSKELEDEADG